MSIKINPSFVVNALRNCGYNTYSAIADIIDNSIEPDVNSKTVIINADCVKGKIKSIRITDDGCGMTLETLNEALTLGSDTGKDKGFNLGCYGAGLKTASLSIGQTVEIWTKSKEESTFYGKLSIKDYIDEKSGDISITIESYNGEDVEFPNGHGTIVKISDIDRLSTDNYQNFRGTLKKYIGEYFNKFISENIVKLYVGKDIVNPIEMMSGPYGIGEELGDGDFEVENHKIRYKAYHIKKIGDTANESRLDTNSFPEVNSRNSGFYIYRQNRLVGRAVTLGLINRGDGYCNQFRCEIFINGTMDSLFGSGFNKMITDAQLDSFNQSLTDKISKNIGPFWKETIRRYKQDIVNHKNALTDEEKAAKEKFSKATCDKLNNNPLMSVNRKGENKKSDSPKNDPINPRGPQKNPNPTKVRDNKWIHGIEEEDLGIRDKIFDIKRGNGGKRYVIINSSHPFYTQLYSKLPDDMKWVIASYFACDYIALEKIGYYDNDEVQKAIDEYNETRSGEVSKALRL